LRGLIKSKQESHLETSPIVHKRPVPYDERMDFSEIIALVGPAAALGLLIGSGPFTLGSHRIRIV